MWERMLLNIMILLNIFGVNEHDLDELLLEETYNLELITLLYFYSGNIVSLICKIKNKLKNILDILDRYTTFYCTVDICAKTIDSLNDPDDKKLILFYCLRYCMSSFYKFTQVDKLSDIILKLYDERIITIDDNYVSKYFTYQYLINDNEKYIRLINNLENDKHLIIMNYIRKIMLNTLDIIKKRYCGSSHPELFSDTNNKLFSDTNNTIVDAILFS